MQIHVRILCYKTVSMCVFLLPLAEVNCFVINHTEKYEENKYYKIKIE